ncbi:MAG TPA: adenine-specific methyltransferase EcoRI family protein [Candidatus Helicobacter avicola]|nr:adenine-specific methyltransferase EcoRI family protein [Candidatus Helicobacter avicola]
MPTYSLSLSRKPTQDKKILETFEQNKHKLKDHTKDLKPDAELQTLFADEGQGNAGDFRSQECLELLRQSDIVVTNPPFSLFREYVATLIESQKKFLIISNTNAIPYKEIAKLITLNKLWLGGVLSFAEFKVPSDYEERATRFRIDENGQKWRSFGNICWMTNLEHKRRNELLDTIYTYEKYKDKYPKYDNYNAINVDKVAEIPMDYEGVMGVPITFLGKHNPKQFEVVGILKPQDRVVNGKRIYARILIRKAKTQKE